MRWESLFADLEGQAEVLGQAQRAAEIDERSRVELGAISVLDRLRGATAQPLTVVLAGELTVRGRLTRVGPDWLLLDEDAGREAVVAARHLVSVRGLVRYSAVPGTASVVESRLGLRHALRGVARDRSTVRVHLTTGSTVDATVDRVGADFVEVAAHAPGEPRRRGEVRDVHLLPLHAITAVRRAP